MPVTIGGRQYLTVAERLVLAHGATARPTAIERIETSVSEAGGLSFVRATVTYEGGRSFTGHAEVSRGGPAGGAQDTSPLEVAETSAVGRALGMSGWLGSAASLAGAEEMRRARVTGGR